MNRALRGPIYRDGLLYLMIRPRRNVVINCDDCMKDIGSKEEPIFVAPGEQIVCRACYTDLAGRPPDENDAEYDPEDVKDPLEPLDMGFDADVEAAVEDGLRDMGAAMSRAHLKLQTISKETWEELHKGPIGDLVNAVIGVASIPTECFNANLVGAMCLFVEAGMKEIEEQVTFPKEGTNG